MRPRLATSASAAWSTATRSTSVSLSLAGGRDRHGRRQPVHDLGQRRRGHRPRQLHDQLQRRTALTVNRKALSITADNQTKTYGTAFTFDETTLATSPSAAWSTATRSTSVTLTSAGAAAPAHGRRQPVRDLGRRRRHRPRQLHHQLRRRDRRLDRQPQGADDHRRQPDQDVRHDVHLR